MRPSADAHKFSIYINRNYPNPEIQNFNSEFRIQSPDHDKKISPHTARLTNKEAGNSTRWEKSRT
jgi:hypothetical protein